MALSIVVGLAIGVAAAGVLTFAEEAEQLGARL
jgi:hypothetical protein